MSSTTYSIHAAYDHSIVATATPADLQQVVQSVAQDRTRDSDATQRFYVHNGRGVIGAFIARNGTAYDTLRDNYVGFNFTARARREDAALPNDEV